MRSFLQGRWHSIREIRTTTKSRVGTVQQGDRTLFVKVYDDPPARKHQSWLRRSRAQREFDALVTLQRKIANPVQPVAWGAARRAGVCMRSLLVTEALPGARNLRDLLGSHRHSAEAYAAVAALPELLRQLGRLHADGTQLRDCLLRNVLFDPRAAGPHCWAWIDLPHLRQRGRALTQRERVRDLAKLDKGGILLLSRTERWRALRAYLPEDATSHEIRSLLLAVDRSRQRLERGSLTGRARAIWRRRQGQRQQRRQPLARTHESR